MKHFGFCIHGAIDGYSRRILWLEVSSSNNDPSIVAKYYVNYVRHVSGTARVIRGDKGTENTHIATIQRYFGALQDDSFSGDNSFIYGKSTSNQRIESWWSQLRRSCADWWISYFKDLEYRGLFCNEDIIYVECLQFCFMSILQNELHEAAKLWNTTEPWKGHTAQIYYCAIVLILLRDKFIYRAIFYLLRDNFTYCAIN